MSEAIFKIHFKLEALLKKQEIVKIKEMKEIMSPDQSEFFALVQRRWALLKKQEIVKMKE